MEFNEKLQELRKSKGLTQEELAEAIFVSRTAVSKWESGRGYPNIDSLKELSRYFSVTIDELICPDEIITAAENEKRALIGSYTALLCGVLDIFMKAGAIVMNPNCSVCWGSCQGVIGEGETLISTGTRNFKGRAGHKDSFVYLASAATVTASAVKGEICAADAL